MRFTIVLYVLSFAVLSLQSMDQYYTLKKEQFCLYNNTNKSKNKKKYIEKIKSFHENNKVSYDKKCCPSSILMLSSFLLPDAVYPLDYALLWNQPDFALFLLKEKSVDTTHRSLLKNSTIHYFAKGIIDNQFNAKHSEILTLLIHNKVSINSINYDNKTPLAEYISQYKKYNLSLNNTLLQSFFDHNAQLYCNEIYGKHEERNCNLLSIARIPFETNDSEKDIISIMATLLQARLSSTKKAYLSLLLILKGLNKKFMPITGGILKPVRHVIINNVIQQHEAFTDIRNSIKDISLKSSSTDAPCLPGNLSKIVSYEFWNQPLRTCLSNLDSIINENYIDKEN